MLATAIFCLLPRLSLILLHLICKILCNGLVASSPPSKQELAAVMNSLFGDSSGRCDQLIQVPFISWLLHIFQACSQPARFLQLVGIPISPTDSLALFLPLPMICLATDPSLTQAYDEDMTFDQFKATFQATLEVSGWVDGIGMASGSGGEEKGGLEGRLEEH